MSAVVQTMPKRIVFTTQQKAALDAITAFAKGEHGAKLMTLEGYAGTGKTTLVGELLRGLSRDIRIAVAAPTNKAVGVLQEKVGDGTRAEFRSIHSFLGLRVKDREDGTRECRQDGTPTLHQYDVAIVDECSMIGGDLFGMIVTSARSCRILFVGDPAQLPPIERVDTGTLSPTFDRVQHKAILTEVVRQAADNPIIALSMRIREAIEAGYAMSPSDLSDALPASGYENACLVPGGETVAYNFALGALQNGLDARIVAYTNATVDRYNLELHRALYGNALPFAVGERIIVNEQFDDARETDREWAKAKRVALYTSEEGTVASIKPDAHPHYESVPAYMVEIDRDGGSTVCGFIPADIPAFNAEKDRLWSEWRRLKNVEDGIKAAGKRDSELSDRRLNASKKAAMFTRAFLPIRHVYAITAHKSQGSTIDTVIVDYNNLARIRDPFTFNRSLYVAATRAARHLALVA